MKRHAGKLIAFACGLVLMLLSVLLQKPWETAYAKDWVRIFSNAALVPGVLLTGLGLIVRISDENFFDGIKYAASSMLSHLRNEPKRHATYYDYIHRKKKKGGASALLLPGLLFLFAAILLTLLFYQYP